MSLFEKKTEKKASRSSSRALLENHYISELVDHYKTRILKEANLEVLTNLPQGEMRLRIEQLISQYMSEEKIILPRHDKELLLTRIIDESIGYGPLEPLLNDATITEILINGPKEIYIEKLGKLQPAPISFRDDSHVRHVIDRIVAPLGRRIDDSSPMVDARLPDGSRVNAVIPPISLNGPLVSIRKFRKDPFKMSDLLKFETLNDDMSVFLDAIVKSKLNVLISGGTGSGKTTLLNVLGNSIPAKERVITIEDSAELRLDKPNVVGMEARPENMEGEGEITIRHLVKNSLRMRPDRIIVGEVRGAEAFDMLQAMNTGHEGSITTVHANTPFDALRRVEGMVIMAGMDLPSSIIREYIVGALDIIVQSSRLTDGTRKITSICEIYRNENGEITINEIFTFKRNGLKGNGQVDGYFTPTGHLPKCLERIKIFGIDIPDTLFTA
ncbi:MULTISPECIES: CpaF family protein [Bacillus]|uniref:CpaF family protein n=1 Tax=Bacillus infantis TaxID=324767 RepID=A0A5D4S2V6_9BACI|nr:cpaF1, RSc0652; probable secretion ATPase protein [Bacillus sp. NRRL B-14911]OXT14858.1 type II secretion system protein E [Bacillus sp. OG2]TYS57925.1 CpaF family protein [Bacillus infantis]